MTSIEYPADVNRELSALRDQAELGAKVLADAEIKLVQLTLAADRIEALTYLDTSGTDTFRKFSAKVKAMDAIEAAELAKVEVNRIKIKLKQITDAQMNVQTQARMIELQWKTAGR
jgi:FtsZ-binding cell division protein ZapB